MLFTVLRRVIAERYDAIHSHEEMGLVGVWLAKWLGIPHLYDMHSSLPQQLSNFKYSQSGALRTLFTWAEGQMVHKSQVVITICQELQDTVTEMGVGERSLLIENVMGGDVDDPPSRTPAEVRDGVGHCRRPRRWRSTPGTFEAYQGVDLLIDAAAIIASRRPDARVLVVGGEPAQVAAAKATAAGARRVGGDDLHRPAAGEGDSRVRAGRRSAGVAAHSRHQHAAEDLLVPAVGQADRGDQPADAHAGADAGDRQARRAGGRAVCRRRCSS